MDKPKLPVRQRLDHVPPPSVDPSQADFFITICCQTRGANQLCHPDTAKALFDAARFYQQRGDWFVPVILLMPDHVHLLASFSRQSDGMEKVIERWKRFTATKAKVSWQRNFFDHRLRREVESYEEKALYIRLNPVRAGLCARPEDWAYVMTS